MLLHGHGFTRSFVLFLVVASNWSCCLCPCRTQLAPGDFSSFPEEMLSSWVWECHGPVSWGNGLCN